jgi:hypothetical protein
LPSLDITTAGRWAKDLHVQISPRSIELFSLGLYRSPHKAIEELIANSFDAGAQHTHVVLKRGIDLALESIVVVDDGSGMGVADFEQHWIIGDSNKRTARYLASARRPPIGKFGIGKLATFVLANEFTHISKRGGKYYAATMDYRKINRGSGDKTKERDISFPARLLTEREAKSVLGPYVSGKGDGFDAIQLFGDKAADTWTAAILTNLKPLAAEVKDGRLKWILETAMPLRDDFELFYNGRAITPSKADYKPARTWRLGAEYTPKNFTASEDRRRNESSPERYCIVHPRFGRIYGWIEAYRDPIVGKSDRIGRSNGFFIYVCDRLVNEDDLYFGIKENKLRHGTLTRFRMFVYADSLDQYLRSNRESILDTDALSDFTDMLEDAFALVRGYLSSKDSESDLESRPGARLASSPRSITAIPLMSLSQRIFDGKASPNLTQLETSHISDQPTFLSEIETRIRAGHFFEIEIEELRPEDGLCVLDIEHGIVRINMLHPFVAAFLDDFEDPKHNVPLELFAVGEVLLEAMLYETISDVRLVKDIVERRDSLLRSLAYDSRRQNALLIANRLWDTRNKSTAFEYALSDAFNAMGFAARRIGGPSNPDGIAEARITGAAGIRRAYRVSLEAKTVQRLGKKQTHRSTIVSSISRHRDANDCDHALVLAEAFSSNAHQALLTEIRERNDLERRAAVAEGEPGAAKTITLMKLGDLMKLVRLVPIKRLSLERLHGLFQLEMPDDVTDWVTALEADAPAREHFRDILEEIQAIQQEKDTQSVSYTALQIALRRGRMIDISPEELYETCKAMQAMSRGLVQAQPLHVDLNQSVDVIINVISGTIRDYPEDEQEIAGAVLRPSGRKQQPNEPPVKRQLAKALPQSKSRKHR